MFPIMTTVTTAYALKRHANKKIQMLGNSESDLYVEKIRIMFIHVDKAFSELPPLPIIEDTDSISFWLTNQVVPTCYTVMQHPHVHHTLCAIAINVTVTYASHKILQRSGIHTDLTNPLPLPFPNSSSLPSLPF